MEWGLGLDPGQPAQPLAICSIFALALFHGFANLINLKWCKADDMQLGRSRHNPSCRQEITVAAGSPLSSEIRDIPTPTPRSSSPSTTPVTLPTNSGATALGSKWVKTSPATRCGGHSTF